MGPRAQAHSRRKRRRKLGGAKGAVVGPRALHLERRWWTYEVMRLRRRRRVSAFFATASGPATSDGVVQRRRLLLWSQVTAMAMWTTLRLRKGERFENHAQFKPYHGASAPPRAIPVLVRSGH